MDSIERRLRRYNQPQILAIGAVVLITWIALLGVAVAPFLYVALGGLGVEWASVITVLAVLGGIYAGVHHIGNFFGRALLAREADEALERLVMAFAESKERHDG